MFWTVQSTTWNSNERTYEHTENEIADLSRKYFEFREIYQIFHLTLYKVFTPTVSVSADTIPNHPSGVSAILR